MRPLSEGARSAFKHSSEAQSWINKQAVQESAYLALISSAAGPCSSAAEALDAWYLESLLCCRGTVPHVPVAGRGQLGNIQPVPLTFTALPPATVLPCSHSSSAPNRGSRCFFLPLLPPRLFVIFWLTLRGITLPRCFSPAGPACTHSTIPPPPTPPPLLPTSFFFFSPASVSLRWNPKIFQMEKGTAVFFLT